MFPLFVGFGVQHLDVSFNALNCRKGQDIVFADDKIFEPENNIGVFIAYAPVQTETDGLLGNKQGFRCERLDFAEYFAHYWLQSFVAKRTLAMDFEF